MPSTYGQKLSYAKQASVFKHFIYYFLCLEFYCGHFEPIPDELSTPKNKVFRLFSVISVQEKKG